MKYGRLREFDERSRKFPMLAIEKPIRSYTWRVNKLLNQGDDGSCVAAAIAHDLIARPSEVEKMTMIYALREIYWEAQKIDPWPGGAYPSARPFYEGTSVLAGVKIAHKLGWFDEYRWAFTFNDLLNGIGHNGPAVLGVNWWSGMVRPNKDGFIFPQGQVKGGHAILANAINIKKEYVTLTNSWGPHWGKNGTCKIHFSDLEKLMEEHGEAVFFMKRHKKI